VGTHDRLLTISEYKIIEMGCNQSSENQWAYANENAPIKNDKPMAVVAPVAKTVDNIDVEGEVDAQTIEEYMDLEKKIASAETLSPALLLQQKKDQLGHLEERLKQQGRNVEALQEQTDLIRHNNDLIGTFDEHVLDEDVRKELLELSEDKHDEKREALAVFNNKEIAKKELENLEEQRLSLENEIESLAEESTVLHTLYARQDELLKKIFGGDYGSVEENQLEEILDQHEELRNRIVEANFKWKQAQLMVDYAYKQLNEAVGRWQALPGIEENKLEERYGVASIARNNLVAAAQNIQGAQRYLSNVQFPYCAPAEVTTLNKATAYIFTDMQTTERHQHAMDCYSTTAKRCGALLQWINQVVNNTIAKDLEDINHKVKESSTELRSERVRLIKIKAKEITGEDIDIAVADINTDVNVEVNLNDLARTEGIDPNLLSTLTPDQLSALNAIAADDLAPPPSQEDIFGKMDVLKSQFEADNEKIERQFKENQMRIENSLQDKIAARRQRRARKNLEEKELEAIKGEKKDKRHKDKKDKKHKEKKHRDKKHKKDKHEGEDKNIDGEENMTVDDAEE